MMKLTEQEFWARVDVREPHECWPWRGYCDEHGYGKVCDKDLRTYKAHRVAFKLANPEKDITNLDIHHVDCETKACCNPEHLEDLTHKEHMKKHRPTHCPHGHEYTEENTYTHPSRGRQCRECKRQYSARRYLKLKEKNNERD